MIELEQFLLVCLPVGYVLAALLHGAAFAGAASPAVARLRRWSLRGTLVLHLGAGLLRWRLVGHFPVDDTWTTVSATVFVAAVLYAWLARRLHDPGSGGVVLGILFLLQLLATGFGDLRALPTTEPVSPFRIVHVATSLIAAAALLLSGTHGVLFLVLYRQMRRKRFGPLFNHLPDLTSLTRLTRHSALAGFICLTVGLNVGIGMAHRYGTEGFRYTDPHVLATILLWIHFGVIAFSSKIHGLSARRASFAAVAGLVVLAAALFLPLFKSLTFHAKL